MSASPSFKTAVETHLNSLAASDPLFAETLKKQTKSIDECCTYITNEVRKKHTGSAIAVSDAEVFSLAVHYYDEDDIKVGAAVKASVSTSSKPAASKPAPKKKAVDENAAKQSYLF